ncbi:TPA: tail fiber protein [Yersinia enterocolitica]|nr:tail fiber protein [Yersinia enterocolitica]
MASVLADFIATQSGNDVLDNGNTATLLASLELAIKKYANSNLPIASTLQQGITKLSSSTNNSSETLAATPKAVKTVSDEGLKITGNLAEIKAAGPAAIAEAQSNLDLAALLGDALQKANNLSEIKAAGPAAVAQTLLNLGLGDVAHLPQLTGIVGTSRNAKMSIPVTLATATFTADELIVQTALGGLQYKLSSFSNTINLATTGAGGMDTGTVPATGYVALYAIYNPTTQVSALLAVNTTSVLAPEICGGVMPMGYTASALVSVWRIVASKFIPGEQVNRSISIQSTTAFTITVSTPATTIASISSIVPLNTKRISGIMNVVIGATGGGNYTEFNLFSSASSVGRQSAKYGAQSIGDMNCNYSVDVNGQNVYYSTLSASGSLSASAYISKYEF